jgi:peptidyl-tRNA hydrolase
MNEVGVVEMMEKLAEVARSLERAAERMMQQQVELAASAEGTVSRIVATVESAREMELMRRLEEAEAKISQLTASAGRKTVSSGTVNMLAKRGVELDRVEAAVLDAALVGLSIEQRIAVKSELMRAGLV